MSEHHLSGAAAFLLVSLVAAGCSAHRPTASVPLPPPSPALPTPPALPPGAIAAATPRSPAPAVRSTTIETTDALLAASLRRAILEPSPESYRALAAEYRRLGVFDRAQSYLEKAQGLAPKDAATYDALARLWRDAGFPRFGLADATRAVFFAPESPAAHNTLGTILQALGQRTLAIAEYERALALDAEASYALNNLCYAWMLERQTERAITACRQALAIEPSMSAARNNLALAYASAGRSDMARATFEESGDKAAAKFNLGIMHLAQGDYRSAVNDFVQAHQLRPSMVSALARARQAAALASSGE